MSEVYTKKIKITEKHSIVAYCTIIKGEEDFLHFELKCGDDYEPLSSDINPALNACFIEILNKTDREFQPVTLVKNEL